MLMTCLCASLFAQVTFTDHPRTLQLYARMASADTGVVTVSGTVTSGGANFSGIRVKVYRNITLQTTLNQNLTFNGTTAQFAIHYGIKSELALYKFETSGISGATETPLRTADSVVCGDVFIIQGQSNAEAHSFSGSASANQSPYIRVFGYSLGATDTLWRIGQGDGDQSTPGNTGQWGLRMARLIVDNEKMPVAIFNGCRSGMAISFFARDNATPANTGTNYGLLLNRLKKAGLAAQVYVLFWFQGEQNANDGTTTNAYKSAFTTLRTGWLSDFPNIKKFYVIQIGSGCNTSGVAASTFSEYVNQIKEAHRQLEQDLPDVVTMSSSGSIHFNDNGACCHYPFEKGYEPIGSNAYWLIARDFYGKTGDNIDAPKIKFAEFSGSREITLILKNMLDSVTWNPGSDSCFRIEGSTAKIAAAKTWWNRIVLTLSASPTGASGISYMGKIGPDADPLVRNSNGIGAVHFYKFPFSLAKYRDSTAVAAIVKANNITLPQDSIAQYSGQRITSLKLNGRSVSIIPPEIGYLDSLKSIALTGNQLVSLPREIMKLPTLASVEVNNNRLCDISDTMTAWINRISTDPAWKSTQKMDATRYCDGSMVRLGKRQGSAAPLVRYRLDRCRLKIEIAPDKDTPSRLMVLRADGKTVVHWSIADGNNAIDLRTIGRGSFIVQVKIGNNDFTKKIVLL
jgi:Leucine-rich repeat (LRR) protein